MIQILQLFFLLVLLVFGFAICLMILDANSCLQFAKSATLMAIYLFVLSLVYDGESK